MVRWTRRLADSLDCPWLAVHIERVEPLAEEAQARLTQNLALARELGAEVITTADTDIVGALLRVARQHNVTQIVVGKPGGLRLLDRLRGARLLQRLIAASGDVDINVVRADQSRHAPRSTTHGSCFGAANPPIWRRRGLRRGGHWPERCLRHAGWLLCSGLDLPADRGCPGPVCRRGPVFLAATLSALLWNFCFLPPRHTFQITASMMP